MLCDRNKGKQSYMLSDIFEDLGYEEDLRKKLSRYDSVCLYGAGDYAELYYSIFRVLGIAISKILVTKKSIELFHDIPVFQADEVSLKANELVIGAYDSVSVLEIRNALSCSNEVLVFSDEERDYLYNKHIFLRRITDLTTGLPARNGKPKPQSLRRILIIRLDVLGDLVMTSAFIRELRHNCPDAEISLLIRPSNLSLFEDCDCIDKVITYDCPSMIGTLSAQINRHDEIDNRVNGFLDSEKIGDHYDAVFLPRELLKGRSCYEEFILALNISSSCIVGRIREFEKEQEVIRPVLEQKLLLVSHTEYKHEAEYMLDMLRSIGGTVSDERLELWVDDRQIESLEELDYGDRKNCVIGLQASTPSRTWPVERYKEVVEYFIENQASTYRFVLLGDGNVIEEAKLFHGMKDVVDLTGKTTLRDVAAIMKKSNLYIGSNTGLMHMAAAAHIPCVTLYATLPDIKETNGNTAGRMGAWMTPHINLFPSEALDDCTGMCRKPYPHCIKQISVEQVCRAIIEIVDK